MNRTLPMLVLTCGMLLVSTAAFADTEADAERAAGNQDFSTAISLYEKLLVRNPESISLRLRLADALAKNRQWDQSIAEYDTVLKRDPKNVEALLGIGTVRRWEGNIPEAKRTYQRVLEIAPHDPRGLKGMGETYELDHDYANAEKYYALAQQRWPKDGSVEQAVYDFRRQRNPRVYLKWESDLSFETRRGGVAVPFGSREEIGLERQLETSYYVSHTDSTRLLVYGRSDKTVFYTHYFGINNTLKVSARKSAYTYYVSPASLGFPSIDTYDQYRVTYTTPFTENQVVSVRYMLRPTTLKFSNATFNAQQIEFRLNSRWTPSFKTMLGVGGLRDLDSNATTSSQLTNRSLVKVGVQWDATSRLNIGAKYITNPELDNTMRATTIGQVGYSLGGAWSLLGRYRADIYKIGPEQTTFYLAARFVPNSKLWTEIGVKQAKRGQVHGNYGLVSISYHF